MDVIEKRAPEYQPNLGSPEAAESVEVSLEAAQVRGIENQGLAGFQAMEMPKPMVGDAAPIQISKESMVRETNPEVARLNLNKVLSGDLTVTPSNAYEMQRLANELGGSEQAQPN
jgi:hypothetical protein